MERAFKPFNNLALSERKLPIDEASAIRDQIRAVISGLPDLGNVTGVRGSVLAHSRLPIAEADGIERAATFLGATLSQFLLAGYAALLSRLSQQQQVCIIQRRKSQPIVTFDAKPEISFAEFLKHAETRLISSEIAFDLGGTSFTFVDETLTKTNISFIETDLSLTIHAKANGLEIDLFSNSGLWDEGVLSRWSEYLRNLWNAAAENPRRAVEYLPLLDRASCFAFYSELNRTAVNFPLEQCVPDLIARRAASAPESLAVVSGHKRYTYRELEEQSTKLAQVLAGMGAEPGRTVAICMERSADMPLAMLGVLKTGAAYVPLDPQHPRRRLLTIVEESESVVVISSSLVALSLRLDSIPVLCVDQPWPETASKRSLPRIEPESLAYVIYTSGTTGKPKGVMLRHRSLTNALLAMPPDLSSSDRLLAVTTISFDIGTLDVFFSLISGATLVVADRRTASEPDRLARLIERHDITALAMTPVSWRMLVDSGWPGKADLKMISGGEALSRELANRLLCLGRELWNCYGPTETTIYSSSLRIVPEEGIVHLGPPIANTSFYVVDRIGQPLPEGVVGELWIGGEGVGGGYLQRPELTEQRFIPDPFDPRKRVFRTGDLVRIARRGELEFFGRLDFQVKLHGYRIELGEIESVLRTHHAVRDAVAVVREDLPGGAALVAYVTLRGGSFDTSDLQRHLEQFLPNYMIPQRIVALEKMPLTTTGKIDRKELPFPEKSASRAQHAKPDTELEARLLQIFREVLGDDSLGVTDSFFHAGGYSLLVVDLFNRIRRDLDLELPISVVFDAPTVRALAQLIEGGATPPILVPIQPKGSSAPLFVIYSYLIYAALADALDGDHPIYGIREIGRGTEGPTLQERADLYVKVISDAYPEGPVSLIGWCAAGSLTVEVARLLAEQGYQIGCVILIDAERPGHQQQHPRRAPFRQRVIASWRFHHARLQRIPLRERFSYFGDGFRHRWERLFEILSVHHRDRVLWLQRYLPSVIPAALHENDALEITFPANHCWQPYPGRILLLRATEEPAAQQGDGSLGWEDVAAQGVQVEFVPGDHETMFKKPHLKVLGSKLREALRDDEWRRCA